MVEKHSGLAEVVPAVENQLGGSIPKATGLPIGLAGLIKYLTSCCGSPFACHGRTSVMQGVVVV